MMLPTVPIALPPFDFAAEPFDPDDRDVLNQDGIMRFVRRNWSLCLTWILVAICAGIAFATLSPAYYTAITTILLEERTLRAPADSIAGATAIDPAYAEGQVQVLQSDEVVGRVVDQNRLGENEEFGKAGGGLRALISDLARFFLDPRPEANPRHTATVNLKRALSVRRLGTSNAVEIGFTSRNPLGSATIANAVAQSYIDSRLELNRKARADAASQLWERLTEFRDKAFAVDHRARDSLLVTPEAGEQAQGRFRELQNSAETYRLLYNSFLQRGYTESLAESSFPGARVVTSAEPPDERSWPRPILVLAIAVTCGVAGGIGHAFLRQAMDRSLRTVEDLRLSTNLGCIACIPRLKGRAWWKTRDSDRRGLQPVYVRSMVGISDVMGKVAVRLQGGFNHRNKSKKIRPATFQRAPNHRNRSIIGVVAPIDGAGTSSIAVHLARVVAESGQRTLLVDANWRKPSLAEATLNSDCPRKLATARATIDLEPESLDVLALRAMAPVSELNATLSIITTLQDLQLEYDCIIVDFHSIEQTADLEASMVFINEVIVVVEARRTSSESLGATLRLVPKNKVAALVLNKT